VLVVETPFRGAAGQALATWLLAIASALNSDMLVYLMCGYVVVCSVSHLAALALCTSVRRGDPLCGTGAIGLGTVLRIH